MINYLLSEQILLIRTLEGIQSHSVSPIVQNNTNATYASKLSKKDGEINWNESITQISRKIRALNPWPGCYFIWNGNAIKILEATIKECDHQYRNGEVIDTTLTIACDGGVLLPSKIQRSGKKPMNTEIFLQGFPIIKGSILNTAS